MSQINALENIVKKMGIQVIPAPQEEQHQGTKLSIVATGEQAKQLQQSLKTLFSDTKQAIIEESSPNAGIYAEATVMPLQPPEGKHAAAVEGNTRLDYTVQVSVKNSVGWRKPMEVALGGALAFLERVEVLMDRNPAVYQSARVR